MFLPRSLVFLLCMAATLKAQQPLPSPLDIVARRALPARMEANPALPDVATLPRVLPVNHKGVYSRCDTTLPLIAITFDDGPDPVLTPRLLDLLKERGIHATFFLVGRNAAAFPDIVRRMVAEGHEVGNHSWSHPLLTQLGKASVESQLQRTHDAIIKACGVVPTLYRPPYGAVGVSQRARIEKTFGYTAILWDVDPQDWQHPRNAQKVYDRLQTLTKPGSIILCHDIHETTVAAMPATLDDLAARGFRFATVSQLIAFTTPPEIVGVTAPPTASGSVAAKAPAASVSSEALPQLLPLPGEDAVPASLQNAQPPKEAKEK